MQIISTAQLAYHLQLPSVSVIITQAASRYKGKYQLIPVFGRYIRAPLMIAKRNAAALKRPEHNTALAYFHMAKSPHRPHCCLLLCGVPNTHPPVHLQSIQHGQQPETQSLEPQSLAATKTMTQTEDNRPRSMINQMREKKKTW